MEEAGVEPRSVLARAPLMLPALPGPQDVPQLLTFSFFSRLI